MLQCKKNNSPNAVTDRVNHDRVATLWLYQENSYSHEGSMFRYALARRQRPLIAVRILDKKIFSIAFPAPLRCCLGNNDVFADAMMRETRALTLVVILPDHGTRFMHRISGIKSMKASALTHRLSVGPTCPL